MSMLETAIKRVGELTAMVEFLKLRVDHYKNRAEHYRSRFVEVIRKNNELRRQAAVEIDKQKSCRNANADARDKALNERDSLRLEVERLKLSQAAVIQIDALRALFGHPPASELYAAQSEIELLRVIRKSQGEGITKLRKEKDELLKRIEHDATVIKRIGDEKVYLEQAVEMLQCDLRDAREATNAGAIRYCDVCKERDAWRQEALNLEVSLHGLGLCSCRVVYSNPVEAMKANPRLQMMLDDNRRNIDNQKSYEAPNCPSS